MVDAMAPFVGAGVVDMAALARHVLQFGFGVKAPEAFMAPPQPPAPTGPDGQPIDPNAPQAPPQPMGPPPLPGVMPGQDQVATGGMPQPTSIPPQVLSMIASQTGGLPNTQM